jgi:cytochrome c5
MTMHQRGVLGYALAAAAVLAPVAGVLHAQSNTGAKPAAQSGQKGPAHSAAGQTHSEGERIFMQNCSRCHATPEGFSPRISGTIVRHMRVRASLSQHDEEELLRFFNP